MPLTNAYHVETHERDNEILRIATTACEELKKASHGEGLCSIHKRGKSTPRLKYLEGRAFIAFKFLHLHGKENPEEIFRILERVKNDHQAMTGSTPLAGAEWQEYFRGVSEMIRELEVAK